MQKENKQADENELNKIREQIDSIDQQIQALIVDRAQCAQRIGEIKKAAAETPVFYRPERESMVLHKIMDRDCGPLDKKKMAEIFRTIMAAGLALQQPMDIAFLGPLGTFSQSACLKHFGHFINLQPQRNIDSVFEQVESGQVHYGVVPIENTIGGLVNATMDAFIQSKLNICGEVSLVIHQNLMRHPEFDEPITRIYSHEQSLTQCRQWLKAHYPQAELIPVVSNAHAAQLAAKEAGSAAIAGQHCAEEYNLHIENENIEDHAHNVTRFLIIGNHQPNACGDDRTSLLATVDNAPGALEAIVNDFAKNDLNITLIKSRPSLDNPNQYIFFLDIDVHQENNAFKMTMDSLKSQPVFIKILGSYPKAIL